MEGGFRVLSGEVVRRASERVEERFVFVFVFVVILFFGSFKLAESRAASFSNAYSHRLKGTSWQKSRVSTSFRPSICKKWTMRTSRHAKSFPQRYDLKDSGAEITLDKAGKSLTVAAPAEFVAKQVIDVIGSKLIKRGIDLTAVKWGDTQPATGQSVRVSASIVDGIDKDTAGRINKDIKALKLKCKVQIEGDRLA